MIDLYCERLDSSFWAEPINALSNLAFIIAAWAVWKHANRLNKLSTPVWVLIGLMLSIGIGSFLFHTFATSSTMILDILPILFFQFVFIWVYIRQIIQLPFFNTLGVLVLYIVFALLGRQFPDILNGSLSYAPAFLVLAGLGWYHFIFKKQQRYILLSAFAIFSLALVLRTTDNMLCPYIPIGTHFLWHLFNGILVYCLAVSLMLNLGKEQ